MMRIGVVSDTHSKELPKQMLDDFKTVDLIIHAGDFCSTAILERFKGIAEVKGVYGNMDPSELRVLLPKSQIIEREGLMLGIFHGEGAPRHLLERVQAEFEGKKLAAVIFGHSHHPMNEVIAGTLFFNPGSATDTVFSPYQSYGILNIKNKTIKGEVIKIQ